MVENPGFMFIKVDDESAECQKVTLSFKLSIKLIDFDFAEVFNFPYDDGCFQCNKQGLSADPAPEIQNDNSYDARSADMWQLGFIYYHCITGEALYGAEDMWLEPRNGYKAVIDNKLREWLRENNLLSKYFKKSSFNFLESLLKINPKQRLSASQCCGHSFFKSYFKKYENKINRNLFEDVAKLQQLIIEGKMDNFPYYNMEIYAE